MTFQLPTLKIFEGCMREDDFGTSSALPQISIETQQNQGCLEPTVWLLAPLGNKLDDRVVVGNAARVPATGSD